MAHDKRTVFRSNQSKYEDFNGREKSHFLLLGIKIMYLYITASIIINDYNIDIGCETTHYSLSQPCHILLSFFKYVLLITSEIREFSNTFSCVLCLFYLLRAQEHTFACREREREKMSEKEQREKEIKILKIHRKNETCRGPPPPDETFPLRWRYSISKVCLVQEKNP